MIGNKRPPKKSPVRLKEFTWASWHHDNPNRLLNEQDAMHQRYPNFMLTEGEGGDLAWIGVLKDKFLVSLTYPADFPYSPPVAKIHKPKFQSQHMFSGGGLCLMTGGDNTWQTNSTCATLVGLVAAWIFCYEQHEANCKLGPNNTPCRKSNCTHWPGKSH